MENSKLVAIGQRIFNRRKQLKLTQEQVAERAGFHSVTLSAIELGKREPELETIVNLCRTLDVSVEYILTGNESREEVKRIVKKLDHFSLRQITTLEMFLDSLITDDGK